MITRCINIDWLECYCLEDSVGFPHDADYFRANGFEVRQRDYGTPMYNEMFTLYDHYNEPFIEIRRAPKSSKLAAGIFSPYAAHVRLANRTCYADGAAKIMADFLDLHGFAFQRISRIDICLDFEKFDSGDKPSVFIQRFMQGRYSKINQANISAHGLDEWDGRRWNSLAWGSKSSMITTRFYCKSMELAQKKDKPYIRQAWQQCELVDDWHTCEKKTKAGIMYKPDIWRLEFEIKAQKNHWLQIEDYNGDRKKIRSLKNTLDIYYTRQGIFQMFLSLVSHYFHFKHVEYKHTSKALTAQALSALRIDPIHPLTHADTPATRELQRKDRCHDKNLFNMAELSVFYKAEKQLSSQPRNKKLDSLYFKLLEYRDRHSEANLRDACTVLINHLEKESRFAQLSYPFSLDEIEILRRIISERTKDLSLTYEQAKQEAENFQKIQREIWSNPY